MLFTTSQPHLPPDTTHPDCKLRLFFLCPHVFCPASGMTCPEERDTIKWAVFSLVDALQGKQIIIFAPGICCAEFPLQLLSIYYAFHGPPELDLKLKATKCNGVSLSTLWLVPCPKCKIMASIICLFVWDKTNRECSFLLRKHTFLAQLHTDVSSRIFSHLSLSSVGRVVLASQFSLRFDNAQGKRCVSFKESPHTPQNLEILHL